ncbi:MAG: Uncharacterized protein CEN90_620 [Parcubacteria group bacterium Licking1014_17]|nr:MAG: Uncharacterized protein CEN90_620 [Parcubacteria group bacterium Licking1014_17]
MKPINNFDTPDINTNTRKSCKKMTLAIILAVVITALIVGGIMYLWLGRSGQTPNPMVSYTPTATPTSVPMDTTGWKTYTNTRYGFEFRYPKNWFLIDNSTTGNGIVSSYDVAYYEKEDNKSKMIENPIKIIWSALDISPNYKTADEEIKALLARYTTQVSETKFNNFVDSPVLVRNDEGGGTTYYLAHDKFWVEIGCSEAVAAANPIVGLVLSTFKFTK